MPFDGLADAVERVFAAADPAEAADLAGLDYGRLDDADRALLAKAHRDAIAEGIKLIGAAAADGDQKARRWLDANRLPMRRRGPYRRNGTRAS